jgi:RNA polymerase sigma factor (sigma-70 family)
VGAALPDGQLLEDFISRHDEAALAALVRRHGPMVWGVCRRILRNHHDAEDAFQATFLVLVRKAASVLPRGMVANWLYGVAHQTALKARATASRRQGRERQVATMPEPAGSQRDVWCDLQPLLDDELTRLPDRYRAVLVLCDLEGKTRRDAARQLAVPEGTVAGRLARARTMLARRLARHGLPVSGAALAAVLSQQAAVACVPSLVLSRAIKAAITFAAGKAAATGVISVKAAILTEGVLKAMLLSKLKTVMSVVVILSVLVFGGGLLMHHTAAGQQTRAEPDAAKPASAPSDQPKPAAGIGPKVRANHAAARTDLDRLQGVWSVVSLECGGQPTGFDDAVFMVDGKRACWQAKDSEIQGGLYLGPTSKPKAYDLATSTRTIEGIYSLEGDTLRLCYDMTTDSKRPAGFITEKGSHRLLVVLKRTHGPEVFPFLLADGTRAFPTMIERKDSPPRPITAQPRAPGPIYGTQARDLPKDQPRHKAVKDAPPTYYQVLPPKAADQREYVIMSRLLQAGPDRPKEVLRLPKVTIEDGQPCNVRIVDGPQNLLEKVVIDEKIKIGTFLDVRVRRLGGNKVRLVLSFQRNEIDKATDSEIRVLGSNVQAIQDVELHRPVKIAVHKDASGPAQRWVEITVDEQVIPVAPLTEQKAGKK